MSELLTTQADLVQRYRAVRAQTQRLCEPLHPEEYQAQPTPDTSPPKWHLGHTTWFFENFILAAYYAGYRRFDAEWNHYFNSYYQSQGVMVDKAYRGCVTRPTIEEVYRYRQYVDQHLEALVEEPPPEAADDIFQLLRLGIHHEEQHQELLLYDIKYILGKNPYHPLYLDQAAPSEVSSPAQLPPAFIAFEEGVYKIGTDGLAEDFIYDNETSRHKVYLHPFGIAQRPVSNEEFLAFVEAGGYRDFRYWHSDGWAWVCENGVEAPMYWEKHDGRWHEYTLRGGLQPLRAEAPVNHVSYYEAWAFAQFMGKRLPTEAEWEVACLHSEPRIPESANLLHTGRLDTTPPSDMQQTHFYGQTWEWTESAYLPYPYYKRPEGALGEYNGKFMVNQMVLRGGSAATPLEHIRPTYRNFFYPYDRWQYAGIRLAESH
jgi:ergothioneine biosynthesis protein EgtB